MTVTTEAAPVTGQRLNRTYTQEEFDAAGLLGRRATINIDNDEDAQRYGAVHFVGQTVVIRGRLEFVANEAAQVDVVDGIEGHGVYYRHLVLEPVEAAPAPAEPVLGDTLAHMATQTAAERLTLAQVDRGTRVTDLEGTLRGVLRGNFMCGPPGVGVLWDGQERPVEVPWDNLRLEVAPAATEPTPVATLAHLAGRRTGGADMRRALIGQRVVALDTHPTEAYRGKAGRIDGVTTESASVVADGGLGTVWVPWEHMRLEVVGPDAVATPDAHPDENTPVGTRVRLIGEHRSHGTTFTREAVPGFLGTITRQYPGQPNVQVRWDETQPVGVEGGANRGRTSGVDRDCLSLAITPPKAEPAWVPLANLDTERQRLLTFPLKARVIRDTCFHGWPVGNEVTLTSVEDHVYDLERGIFQWRAQEHESYMLAGDLEVFIEPAGTGDTRTPEEKADAAEKALVERRKKIRKALIKQARDRGWTADLPEFLEEVGLEPLPPQAPQRHGAIVQHKDGSLWVCVEQYGDGEWRKFEKGKGYERRGGRSTDWMTENMAEVFYTGYVAL